MIYTFASHKGGVGRTFTLVHAGIRLASRVRRHGLRVLLVDMDLDAPGFAPYFPETDIDASPGFASLLAEYRGIVPQEQRAEALCQMLDPTHQPAQGGYILPVEGAPNLALLPAGRSGRTTKAYLDIQEALRAELAIGGQEWPLSSGFLGDLRSCLQAQWPFVLIDARAGMGELTFASALVLADVLVPCFRLNQANLDGVQCIQTTFLKRQSPETAQQSRNRVVPVASPVPTHSSPRLMDWLKLAHRTFFPELQQPQDGTGTGQPGAAEATLSPFHKMFPLVHRIYEDQEANLGEWRFLRLDGTPASGMDEQVPLLRSVDLLVDHLRSLNAALDPGGAELVEEFLLSQGDRASALSYWLKRARLCPQDTRVWSDLDRSYLVPGEEELRAQARSTARELLDELRAARHSGATDSGLPLATALLRHCWSFGSEIADCGLGLVDEAISLVADDPAFLEGAQALAGRIVMALLEQRGLEGALLDGQGRPLTRNLAVEHLRCSLRHARTLGHRGGETHLLLARALRGLHRHGEAVRQLDVFLRETAGSQGATAEVAQALVAQAEALEWLGHYDWALRNLLRSRALSEEPATLLALQRVARKCGQQQLAADLFAEHTRLFPGDLRAYRHETLRRSVLGMHEAARKLLALTGSREEGRAAHQVLRGVVELLAGELPASLGAFQRAAAARSDRYTQALATVVAALQGQRTRFSPLSGDLDEDRLSVSLAAFALQDVRSLKVLTAGWEILPRLPAMDRMELGLLWTLTLLLEGSEKAEHNLAVVSRLCASLPLLAVAHRTCFEGMLAEKIWTARRAKVPQAAASQLDALLRQLHEAPALLPDSLAPRREAEPLPHLAFVADAVRLN